MKRIFLALLLILTSPFLFADTHTAASASYADVNTALGLCSSGDTLAVPAGTQTWSTPLAITISLHLQGNGIASTIITNGTSGIHGAIEFTPATGEFNKGFEVSGFSFDVSDQTYMILIQSTTGANISKISIHGNDFSGFASGGYCFGFYNALCIGVVFNNTFTGANCWQYTGGNIVTWDAVTAHHDDGIALYIEDNTFNITDLLTDGARGARYVVRHNDINLTRLSGSCSPMFDAHGNQTGGHLASTMEVAIYENSIDNSNNTLGTFFDQRGAMALVYNNTFIGTYMGAFSIRNEYTEGSPGDDWYIATTNPQPQHITESYYWTNVDDIHTYPSNYEEGTDAGDEIHENAEFFLQRAGTFDGSGSATHGGGVGVGLLSARPASGLTVGAGYWATDTNTLYRATGATTWEAYYTPYTYPHPLRGEGENYSKATVEAGAKIVIGAGGGLVIK